MDTIILNESGYDTGMTFAEYCAQADKYSFDKPSDFSDNPDDFVFVSKEYAMQDPAWGELMEWWGWPDELPCWQYRPQDI